MDSEKNIKNADREAGVSNEFNCKEITMDSKKINTNFESVITHPKEEDMNIPENLRVIPFDVVGWELGQLRRASSEVEAPKGIPFTPAMLGVRVGHFHDMEAAMDAIRCDHPELVGHIKVTNSGDVEVYWVEEDVPWELRTKVGKLASRPGLVAARPQVVRYSVADHPDGQFIHVPISVMRKFNRDRGLELSESPSQVSSFELIGKGTIVPTPGDTVTISADCGLPVGTEGTIDLGLVSGFQHHFRGRVTIGPRLLINATVAATCGDRLYVNYAKLLHRKFDAWYHNISDTENGNIDRHSSGAVAELAYHRLPTPIEYRDRLAHAVSTAVLGRRLGPKIKALSGYAIAADLPYGVCVCPAHKGVVTTMTHRFPGIHYKTFGLPSLTVGQCSRAKLRLALRRVGISPKPETVSKILDIAHRDVGNCIYVNPEFWYELQGDFDGDPIFCVPFNHRARVQEYHPGITEDLESHVIGRSGDAKDPQGRIDQLKVAAMNAIGIIDYQTFNAIAYYASNWRNIDRKRRKKHIDNIFNEYATEYHMCIAGNKKRTDFVSRRREIHQRFEASFGMTAHPDAVINRVLKRKEVKSISTLIELLYAHQSTINSHCLITDKWLDAYLGVMESRVSLVPDTEWAVVWDRFIDHATEHHNTSLVIDVSRLAYRDSKIDWQILVRWAAIKLSEGAPATISDIARLILPDRGGVVARNVTLALSVARILGIDLSPVRHVLRRKPRVDVELFGVVNQDYHPDHLDSVVDDDDDDLGYSDDEMTEF